MDIARRSDKSSKVNTTDHPAEYAPVVPEFSPGNLVLTFTAGAYEEFKIVSLGVLQGQGLSIKRTNTTEINKAVVSESVVVNDAQNKLCVLNFYNTSSKVVLNGNQLHMSVFISSTLPDILNVLDHNKDFIAINSKIRHCCTVYLNSNQASCMRTTDINTSINHSDDKAVECEICNKWLHYKCENLTDKEVDEIENNLTLQYNCNSCKTLETLQSDLLVSQLKHAPENTGIRPTTSIRSRLENSDTSSILSHPTVLGSTPPRLNNCNVCPIPVTISATPTTTCNNTNILEEEIKHLKSQLD
ncbi:MLL1 [Mytilus edulis]|uniref:MLL1 n=1 Tax=Mytilus edulis TaxID=6550 RepID=A0A8S3R6T8_MYTED|nr:MLL1 [Mytilus edulis]